jgi:hypothetical protein
MLPKSSLSCAVYNNMDAHICMYAYINIPEHADNAVCNFSNSMCMENYYYYYYYYFHAFAISL